MLSPKALFLRAVKEGEAEFVACIMETVDRTDPWRETDIRLLEMDDQELLEEITNNSAVFDRFYRWSESISRSNIIHSAVRNGRLKAVQFILQQSPEAVFKNQNRVPLLFVCKDEVMAKLLVDHGADLSAQDANGNTPLAACSTIEIAELFLSHGADANTINHKCQSVLNLAAKRGRSGLMSLLIKYQANNWSCDADADKFIETLFEKHLRWLSVKNSMLPISLPT
jgi:ankyrin repeat protein